MEGADSGSGGASASEATVRSCPPTGDGRDAIASSAEAQKSRLKALHESGVEVHYYDASQRLGGGAEHAVEATPHDYVLKHTAGGRKAEYGIHFGFIAEGEESPGGALIDFRDATPLEYVHRIEEAENLFPTESKIVGTSVIEGRLGFVTRQKRLDFPSVSEAVLETHLNEMGYRKISDERIINDHIANRTWFNPHSGYLLVDVKADNFKQVGETVVPIDLIVQKPAPGSVLYRAAVEGISKK